ncbi:hypothetical protein [Coprobacter tertius]|uniref:Uncharacterized protein n=1 Tax=Coprobacter tertius TaxID=2944915 RepID=A0ABT1MG93_9BACT|nr:hypothetical protein [Coprobacter tertius]MCP9611659.1 hypothetical protein [Coprobacter tertius]
MQSELEKYFQCLLNKVNTLDFTQLKIGELATLLKGYSNLRLPVKIAGDNDFGISYADIISYLQKIADTLFLKIADSSVKADNENARALISVMSTCIDGEDEIRLQRALDLVNKLFFDRDKNVLLKNVCDLEKCTLLSYCFYFTGDNGCAEEAKDIIDNIAARTNDGVCCTISETIKRLFTIQVYEALTSDEDFHMILDNSLRKIITRMRSVDIFYRSVLGGEILKLLYRSSMIDENRDLEKKICSDIITEDRRSISDKDITEDLLTVFDTLSFVVGEHILMKEKSLFYTEVSD